MNKKSILLIAAAGFALGLSGCNYGQVEQGRVIAFDEGTRTVTMINDSARSHDNPIYNALPPLAYKLPPEGSKEVGPLPRAGKCLGADIEGKKLTIFDVRQQKLVTVPINITGIQEKVAPTDPVVYDADEKKEKPHAFIKDGVVTTYLFRSRQLVTFTVPPEYADYPADTWAMGDDVRIYTRMRFMNVSQTNIYKR